MTDDLTADAAPATILLVDDNSTKRYIISNWLRRAGHTVFEAEDGTQALEIVKAEVQPPLEAAIVDVRLPDMSGFEVCERIKADPRTSGLPVVHVSGSAIAVGDRTQGLHRGADAYLVEPIDPDELLATVTAVLRYARARQRAESLAARLTTLNRATLEIYGAVSAEAATAAAATGLGVLMSSPAVVLALSPLGQGIRTTVVAPDVRPVSGPMPPEALAELARLTSGQSTVAEVTQLPHDVWNALLPGGPLGGDVAVVSARTKRDRPPVCLAVDASAIVTSEDRDLFTQLAHACALSLEALRSYSEEHSLAMTLQRTFLPDRLPTLPGFDLQVRYQPATSRVEIGGDFYEAIETPGGLLLAIGDVAGHSLEAAVVMGELRHALRAYALEGHAPQAILERLDTLLTRLRPGVTATVCLVLVEPGGRRVHVANGGHIPPLLLAPDGTAGYVREHSSLLGLNRPHRPPTTHPTAPGTRLLLATDGIIEVRGEDLETSLEDLRYAAEEGPADLGELCDVLLRDFGRDKDDDIALLAARLA